MLGNTRPTEGERREEMARREGCGGVQGVGMRKEERGGSERMRKRRVSEERAHASYNYEIIYTTPQCILRAQRFANPPAYTTPQ